MADRVLQAVSQEELSMQTAGVGLDCLREVVLGLEHAVVALAPRVPEEALIVVAATGDRDLEKVSVAQSCQGGRVTAA